MKKHIKTITLQNKWEEFVLDNSQDIRLEIFGHEPKEKSDNAWYFATDLFFDELSEEYDSEMLERRFEEIIFTDYCDSFMDELFKELDNYDCFEDDEK